MRSKFIDNLPIDKKDHVIVGQLLAALITPLALIGYCIDGLNGVYISATIGFLIGTTVNVGKELIYDWLMKKGSPEWLDFISTESPILTSYAPYLITGILYYYF